MHGFGHLFAVGHRLHHRTCAFDRISGCKDTGHGGAAHLVRHKQTPLIDLYLLFRIRKGGAGALTDGHNDTVRRVEHLGTGQLGESAVLPFFEIPQNHAAVGDLHRLFVEEELHPFQFGIAGLVIAGRHLFGNGNADHMAGAVADGGAGHIHGRIARADDDHTVAQVIDIRVLQVIDGVMYIAQALPLDAKGIGAPDAGANENSLVTVTEKVLQLEGLTNIGIGTDLDVLEAQVAIFKIIQNALGQPEFGDAVAQHTANLVVGFKDSDIIAVAGQNDRDGQSRRAGADDGRLFAVGLGRAADHLRGIGGGDVVFNDREMHRRAFDATNAVSLTLVFMVADQAAHRGQRVILEQHPPGLVELVGLEQANYFRNVGVDGTPFLAARLFAAQTKVRLIHNVQCHRPSPFRTDFAVSGCINVATFCKLCP